jgi:hypothetical protein
MLGALQAVATRQGRLPKLGLVPPGPFEDIARSTVSLATGRFFAKVRRGRISVRRDAEVTRLLADGGRPLAELSDGGRVPADLVLCGTGFRQGVPFLRNIDELLGDIGLDVSAVTRRRQWLLPIDPGAYRSIEERLLRRAGRPARATTYREPSPQGIGVGYASPPHHAYEASIDALTVAQRATPARRDEDAFAATVGRSETGPRRRDRGRQGGLIGSSAPTATRRTRPCSGRWRRPGARWCSAA